MTNEPPPRFEHVSCPTTVFKCNVFFVIPQQ